MGTLDSTGEGGWHMSDATQTELGSVVSLWRYPVKSMMGEELNATEVTERGLLGRSCVRPRRPLRREGGDRQEPAKMAASLRFPRHLHRAGACGRTSPSSPHRPPR